MTRILIMGLPGAGKTTLAHALREELYVHAHTVLWLNADKIRTKFDDWDFSLEGRIRQSVRMATLASESTADFVIADFVAPLVEMRENFNADWTIWLDTRTTSRYEDTDKLFIQPTTCDYRITEQNAEKWASIIAFDIVTDAAVSIILNQLK